MTLDGFTILEPRALEASIHILTGGTSYSTFHDADRTFVEYLLSQMFAT